MKRLPHLYNYSVLCRDAMLASYCLHFLSGLKKETQALRLYKFQLKTTVLFLYVKTLR